MHFFSNNIKDAKDTFFHCEWLNDLHLVEAQSDDLPIFKFVITDLHDYWPGTVTRKELESFKKTGGSMEKMSSVVKAACQGAATFDNEALQWKVEHKKDTCKVTLITVGELEFELGHFSLSKAPASQRHTHHLEWMQTAVTLSSKARETDEVLTERTHDLEVINAKLQSTIQSLTDSKVESELNIFMEFKEILNAKKQKIHRLETKLKETLEQQLEVTSVPDHSSEPESGPTTATKPTTTKKKRKAAAPKASPHKKRKATTKSSSRDSNTHEPLPPTMTYGAEPQAVQSPSAESSSTAVVVPSSDPSEKESDEDDMMLSQTIKQTRRRTPRKPSSAIEAESEPSGSETE